MAPHPAPSPTSSTAVLHGTPVVPGVAYAPAVVATASISPDAIARFEQASPPEAEAALAAYDEAVAATSAGLAERAAGVQGAAAEVLTATAGLARDKGLRSPCASGSPPATRCWSRWVRRSTSSPGCSPPWAGSWPSG